MSFKGMIEDVAVVDVMQLIRLGGHSGTLSVNSGREEGFVGFERGRIVSAWNQRSRRLGELLVAAGAIDEGQLVSALEAQNAERPRRTIGQILARMGATTSETIRDVMGQEIERVVGEILAWKTGAFDFAIDDLTPLVEVTRFTGAPKVDLDTQAVLMDVLRRMDEGVARSARIGDAARADTVPGQTAESESKGEVDGHEFDALRFGENEKDDKVAGRSPEAEVWRAVAVTAEHVSIEQTAASDRPRFQIVSPDTEIVARLNDLLEPSGDRVSAVALRDAGASLLGETPPIVVIDLRYQVSALTTLSALCRSRPRASVIALFEGRAPLREMYQSGVLSVTSSVPATVVACMRSAARQRKYMANEHAITEGIRVSFARLRRIIVDLRSGLLNTSVSANLMSAVAESLDRGVLFVPHLERLVALGAFGNTAWGAPLAKKTQGLIMPVGSSGVFRDCDG